MVGIYIHIPFCKRKCFYCDFYSVAGLSQKESFIGALIQEIEFQKYFFSKQESNNNAENISTIYFGGGTPSLLSAKEIEQILAALKQTYNFDSNQEITLEANPDDLSIEYLNEIRDAGINRLSIGIQSFFDDDLQLLNRRHSAQQAIDVVRNAQGAGFTNISIDLIYGLPGMTESRWKKNLENAFELNIQHISAYHLSIEAKTVFAHFLDKGKITLPSEDASLEQYQILIGETKKHGFIQYEISNFGKENYFSIHNSNYWKQKKYLGLGPSAHSYNGDSRSWNISNVTEYIKSISNKIVPCETEILSDTDKFNDYIMTSLRTMWGIDKNYILQNFGEKKLNEVVRIAEKYKKSEHIISDGFAVVLTDKGRFISDKIISDFFILQQ